MNQEIKKLWLEALRSGEYKQVKGTLRRMENDEPSHCCLGVLCEIVVKNNTAYYIQRAAEQALKCEIVLPNTISDYCGLNESNPSIKYVHRHTEDDRLKQLDVVEGEHIMRIESLGALNDNNFTFDQIADLIERFL